MTATKYKPDTELNLVNDPEDQKLFKCHIHNHSNHKCFHSKFKTAGPPYTRRPTLQPI